MIWDQKPSCRNLRIGKLLKNWLKADDAHVKESLIGLFMLLYAQTAHRTVRIKLADLRMIDGIYHIKFGKTEIPLVSKFLHCLNVIWYNAPPSP